MTVTLAIAAFAAAAGILFGWLGARPPDFRKGPRLVPWRFLMLLCAVVVLYMLVHVVNLMGVTTGR